MDIDRLFNRGKELGIEDMEVYVVEKSSTKFKIYKGELENQNISKEKALSLRGVYNGKMGYSYTEKLTEDSIDELISNLIQYAQCNEREYVERLSGHVKIERKDRANRLNQYDDEKKISFLKSIEKMAYSMDERVYLVQTCNYEEYENTVYIKNTKGLELKDSYGAAIISLFVVAKDNDDTQTGYSHRVIDDLLEEDKTALVDEAVKDAVNMLGASSIPSGNYKVILRNNVAADLFGTMVPVFLANMVQENMSLMKGKIGEQVGSDLLNIVEDPFLKRGIINRMFDDEGTPTFTKHIIKNGILKTILHNNKTAEKDGIKSTGNGFRTSHKSTIGVMPTNMYIEMGNNTLEEMIRSIDTGVLITDIQGLHAGINTVSGEISLSSNGYYIEDGKIVKPVNQITIAGNFYDMIKGIEALGDDIGFSISGNYYFVSPSMIIDRLTVSGN
ncbi:TldD/PmbA family protein [Tepidimicrobium xylanilyticum]|uniref:PmbA protein n=1 Tax=Tepidimicrobium xylanilyticum TaxID=1123352 RepID=A0A1H2RB97_9FIRM|nr:TldD/PmbA family protein [Tepidimicrobium xylanilyticum]SDW16565.1 PmbA protein [Tepidimicrobium xylanilyticum]